MLRALLQFLRERDSSRVRAQCGGACGCVVVSRNRDAALRHVPPAQEPPYFVTYSHALEEPDNLEVE